MGVKPTASELRDGSPISAADRSHRPNNLQTSLSAVEERAVCELRSSLQLPLDDIVEVMRRCINAKLSRSAIHRCLQRHGISRLPKPDRPKAGVFETASIGFIHIDLKHLPALERRTSYAFVAIDRATRYVYLEIHSRRDGATSTGFDVVAATFTTACGSLRSGYFIASFVPAFSRRRTSPYARESMRCSSTTRLRIT